MFTFRVRVLVIVLSLAPLSAAPPASPDEMIRQGNAAVERGNFNDALLFYQQAEERGSDPGLIAFNRATAYYQLEDYRRAESHYRMALDDAAIPPERYARALYNLGNSLVRQAGETELRLLREAIRCYEQCLDAATEEGLRTDAGHNLELAKLLWNKARAKSSSPTTPNSDEPPDTPPKAEPKDKKTEPKNGSDPGKEKGGKDLSKGLDPKGQDGKGDQEAMGKKPLPQDLGPPVPPDTDQLQRQSPEDTLRALRDIELRLHRERTRLRLEAGVLEKPSGRDW